SCWPRTYRRCGLARSCIPPVDALSTRSSSLAEHFLDLHPDVQPRSEDEIRGFPGERTGAKAQGAAKSSIERKRQNLSRALIALGLTGGAYATYQLGKEWESEEEKMKLIGRSDDKEAIEQAEKGGWEGFVGRIRLRGADHLDYLNRPAWDPLLPPPLPEPHYRPYTLVIDLDDMLIHSSWDIDHGWRTAKRPGVDYFLAYMSQFYEIVLFTTQPAYTAAPIVEKIDPYGAYIPWKLFKEATRYKNKQLIKDLSYLNRPLERTIILDTDASHFQLQPENGIVLAPWHGSKGDATSKELVALIPFLEALAVKGVKDVRPVIKYYEGKHIPTAYFEAELKAKKELEEKWQREKTDNSVKGWISSLFGGLTKVRSSFCRAILELLTDARLGWQTSIRDSPPETDVERVRKNAQKLYLDEQKYWKDNEAAINQQIEEDKQRQLKECVAPPISLCGRKDATDDELLWCGRMSTSVLGFMGLKPPTAAEQLQQQLEQSQQPGAQK
ncbi:SPOSA6832_00823, partial [Sporobolomyces salmonicolor]